MDFLTKDMAKLNVRVDRFESKTNKMIDEIEKRLEERFQKKFEVTI